MQVTVGSRADFSRKPLVLVEYLSFNAALSAARLLASAPAAGHASANAAWYFTVPETPRSAPGRSSMAMNTSCGTSYSHDKPKLAAGEKPNLG
jgi:hypothetical protein